MKLSVLSVFCLHAIVCIVNAAKPTTRPPTQFPTRPPTQFPTRPPTQSPTTTTNWLSPAPTMPRDSGAIAVGWYNDTIYIAGNYDSSFPSSVSNQFVSFNILSETFTDHGQNFFTHGHSFEGQGYTQTDDILYMIWDDSDSVIDNDPHIRIYDMKNDQHTDHWEEIRFVTGNLESISACLASSQDHLFITGMTGSNSLVQVLSLTTYQFIQSPYPPLMTNTRSSHGCVYHNNYLWTFGGQNGSPYYAGPRLAVNERIDTVDITQNAWDDTIPPLAYAVIDVRAVLSGDDIYIIGGESDTKYMDIVQIMDTNTLQIRTSLDRLPYAASQIGVVSLGHAIYAFGGMVDSGGYFGSPIDRWRWIELSILSPVPSAPSEIPTISPFSPSVPPTKAPTRYSNYSGPSVPTIETTDIPIIPTTSDIRATTTIDQTDAPNIPATSDIRATATIDQTDAPSDKTSIASFIPSIGPTINTDATANGFQTSDISVTESDDTKNDDNATIISTYGVSVVISVSGIICSAATVCIVCFIWTRNQKKQRELIQDMIHSNENANMSDVDQVPMESVPRSDQKAVLEIAQMDDERKDEDDVLSDVKDNNDEMEEENDGSSDDMYNNEGINEVNETMDGMRRDLDAFAQKVGIDVDKFTAAGFDNVNQIIEMVRKGKTDLFLNSGTLTLWEIHCLQEYIEKNAVGKDPETDGVTTKQTDK